MSVLLILPALLGLFPAAPLRAQAGHESEVALAASAFHSIQVGTSAGFWAAGGGAEAGWTGKRGLGLAASVNSFHAASIAASGIPLSQVDGVAGPRYRHRAGDRGSYFGEVLLGAAHGFGSSFPSASGMTSSAGSLALHVGGGLDVRMGKRLGWRALEATWIHTALPNGANDHQNSLLLQTGVIWRWHVAAAAPVRTVNPQPASVN